MKTYTRMTLTSWIAGIVLLTVLLTGMIIPANSRSLVGRNEVNQINRWNSNINSALNEVDK
jgi:hypothetical protein